jgi:peptidoglycan/LPS O-acetylase OafA/YrhL
MGAAMIWVILFHYNNSDIYIPVLSNIFLFGYGGVDIFLLLSGVGLYFSLSKDDSIKTFYIRRLLRILPYYMPVVFLIGLFYVGVYGAPLSLVFFDVSALGFWFFGDSPYEYDWYISAILLLYLITPLYFRLFRKKPLLVTAAACLLGAALSVLITRTSLTHLLIFTARIPVYFTGFFLGYVIKENKYTASLEPLKIALLLASLGAGVFWLLYNYMYLGETLAQTGLAWYPFVFIAFPLCMLAAALMDLCKTPNFKILSFFGKYSLAIYIFHMKVFNLLAAFIQSAAYHRLVSLAVSLLLAFLFQNLVESIIKKIGKSRTGPHAAPPEKAE